MFFDVCIAIGSNIGDPASHVEFAFEQLRALHSATWPARFSRIHQTHAVGPAQPDYLNACARIATHWHPALLMHLLLDIEQQCGRVRGERWGPRTLDLDLLTVHVDGVPWTCDLPMLTVPHPEMHRRDFVLLPLREVL